MFRPQITALETIVWRAERVPDTRIIEEAMLVADRMAPQSRDVIRTSVVSVVEDAGSPLDRTLVA